MEIQSDAIQIAIDAAVKKHDRQHSNETRKRMRAAHRCKKVLLRCQVMFIVQTVGFCVRHRRMPTQVCDLRDFTERNTNTK
jgi:hypothetical protein